MITLATWAVAPDWLTPAQAAALMGLAYTPEAINTLIAIGAVDAEQDETGAWLVEKIGLSEYQTALWEVLTYEQHRRHDHGARLVMYAGVDHII
jgi:hypothetical protein